MARILKSVGVSASRLRSTVACKVAHERRNNVFRIQRYIYMFEI